MAETHADRASSEEGRPPRSASSANEERLVELEDRWRRAAADLENLRRRFERELERGRLVEREAVLEAFLGVLDGLERALAFARQGADGLVSGLEAVSEEARRVLTRFGYERIDEEGVVYDPARHEVVALVAPDGAHPEGTVVEVTRAGWASKDRVLRPASVVVASRKD